MLYVITDTLLKVASSTNKTGHHVIHYNWHIVENGIKLYYVIADVLLKVALNTNKTGHHDITDMLLKHK
jgi:predicted carbohydrate-binding protein with CBM5 and CBM33 domain